MRKIFYFPNLKVEAFLQKFITKYNFTDVNIKKQSNKNFPTCVFIENTNCCNAHCIICPREKHARTQGFMDFALYAKLIKEIASHKHICNRIHLHNFGEPLLDKQFVDRIRLAKKSGIRYTYFVTNASLLTPELSSRLIKAGVDEFKVSFYGVDREEYNSTMCGLDFNTTLANIIEFFRIRKSMRSITPKVKIQYMLHKGNIDNKAKFFQMFRTIIDPGVGDTLVLASLHNVGNGRNYRVLKEKADTVCPHVAMTILWDGKVVPCCMDFNGMQVVGDVANNTITEVRNKPGYIKMREDIRNLNYKNYPLCSHCSLGF